MSDLNTQPFATGTRAGAQAAPVPVPDAPKPNRTRIWVALAAVGGLAAGAWLGPSVFNRGGDANPHAGMNMTAGATTQPGKAERKVKYYWDPMQSPPYISDKPGVSPMGMQLIPVYEDDISAGPTVTIDPRVVQNIGVRAAPVSVEPLASSVRAVGYFQERTPDRLDINLRVSGWIQKLHADTEGMHLKEGDPLFDLYSPEVTVGIDALITQRRANDSAPKDAPEASRRENQLLYDSARQKLVLWGLSDEQVEQFAKLDRAPTVVTFYSPIDAHLVDKQVYNGSAVKAGDLVMRLANRSILWLDVQVFERQLPLIKEGQNVRAITTAQPSEVFEGKVSFIFPHVDPMTRTTLARLEVANPSLLLRQGMYATAEILVDEKRAIVVPREAVIDTGTRKIVFVVVGEGRFEPRLIKSGLETPEGLVEVLAGLAPGEQVVTSGQFLLDSESRLREAIQKQMQERLVNPGTKTANQSATAPSTPDALTPMPAGGGQEGHAGHKM